MKRKQFVDLGTREREIMESVFRLGEATVENVRRELTGAPHYSTVRTMMGKLEAKGYLRHRRDGRRFVYAAVPERPEVQRSTMRRVLAGLFEGSTERALTALLEVSDDLSDDQLAAIEHRIREYRERDP